MAVVFLLAKPTPAPRYYRDDYCQPIPRSLVFTVMPSPRYLLVCPFPAAPSGMAVVLFLAKPTRARRYHRDDDSDGAVLAILELWFRPDSRNLGPQCRGNSHRSCQYGWVYRRHDCRADLRHHAG